MATREFRISTSVLKELRKVWVDSIHIESDDGMGEEISGVLLAQQDSKDLNVFHLSIASIDRCDHSFTYSGDNGSFSVSGSGEDHPYSFHTHPIQTDFNGNLANYPNIISNEDMIGVVQDSYKNKGLTSNPKGILQFDIILTPLGIFCYCATEKIITEYIKKEPHITCSNVMEWIKELNIDIPQNHRSSIKKGDKKLQERYVLKCKERISAHDTQNPYFAEIENAVINEDFEKMIGNWYYTKKRIGWFSSTILPSWSLLGYAETCLEFAPLLLHSTASREEQVDFFCSEDFFMINWDECDELKCYTAELERMGFGVSFFKWSSASISFSFPH